MNIDDAFPPRPSRFVKPADLQGKGEITVRILEMRREKLYNQKSLAPVLYFEKARKALVLNKTNAASIAELYGKETDNWRGQEITLYQTMVAFGDRMVPGIRVKTRPKLRAIAGGR